MKTILVYALTFISILYSQEHDSLKLKFDIITGYQYSVYGTRYRPVTNFFQGGYYSNSFKSLFNKEYEEYIFLLRAEKRNRVFTRFLAPLIGGPIGLAIANLTNSDPLWDNKYDYSLLAFSAISSGLAYIYTNKRDKDLIIAVDLRNNRLVAQINATNK